MKNCKFGLEQSSEGQSSRANLNHWNWNEGVFRQEPNWLCSYNNRKTKINIECPQ